MLQDDRRTVSVALLGGLLAILIAAGAAFWLSHEQRLADEWVRHTSEVEDRLNHAQIDTARAEINRRGFLLTRDPAAVRTYAAMRQAVVPQLDAIVRLVVDNAPQEQRALALRSVVIAKLDEMQRSIDVAASGQDAAAVAIVASPQSRQATAQVLRLIDRMHANEDSLLIRRHARSDRLEHAARFALASCALLVLLLVLLVAQDRRRRLVLLAGANRELEDDILARKRLERELQEARRRAEAADAAKSSFLAHMSHEIRTPMNGVIGFTRLMLDGELSEQQRRHAELIADSGRAMMRLLNDILDLSKIEAGHLRVSAELFDLPHAIRASGKLMAPAVRQKGLSFDLVIADEVPVMVIGDGLRLRQILINLIGNATKFTSEGAVSVRADVAEDRLRIEVADTGIGIAPERQQAIFQRFVQADDGITPRFGGTGLGLSISMHLAQLMGGTLEVSSAPGHGSRFLLILPLRLPAAAADAAGLAAPNPVALPERRAVHILVAEDHDVNQMLIRELLERLGHRTDVVPDGASAVVAVASAAESDDPYDLVLMDMQMPGMDGIEATREIRARGADPQSLPIIALTANAYAEDIAACLSAGMQAHLAKPLDDAELDGAIRRWARRDCAGAKPEGAARFSPRLRERYAARREELIGHIAGLAQADRVGEGDVADLREMLHKFLGSAQMFGDEALAAEARTLETDLASVAGRERVELLRRAAVTFAKVA